jgi:carbamoyl-phosphate synthase large subunit
MPAAPRVLITSASRKVPLLMAARDAVRRLDSHATIVAGDIDPNAPVKHLADDFWLMPRTTDQAADEILSGCRQRAITCVLPTRDGELLFWACHAARFRDAGIFVIVSAQDSVDICLDKLAFSQFGEEYGLPIIPSSRTLEGTNWTRYVVKERYGAGSRSLGLDLDRAQAAEHARSLSEPIFQPFVRGSEISIDGWLDRAHHLKGLVLRRRDVVIDGESQVTTTFRNARVEGEISRLLVSLNLCGPIVTQALLQPDGSLSIIECNTRLGGASTAGIAAGLQSLYWSFLEAHGGDVVRELFERVPGEIRLVRAPADFILHDPHL